jgi:uncharacterized membrane protein
MNKSRLEAFSDGVLAIIITIMVLEIKVPHGSSWHELEGLTPVVVSYIMSFVFVGIYWGNHHHLLHSVKNVSSGIIWSNLNLLFWLSLIPFATAWMGENHFASNPVAVYGALLLVCGASYTILQKAVERHSHDIDALRKAFLNLNKKGVISVVCYTSAIPAAYINPLISGILFVVVSIVWMIPDKNIEQALKSKSTE